MHMAFYAIQEPLLCTASLGMLSSSPALHQAEEG